MNAKYSVFNIEAEAILYLLLHNVHDSTFEVFLLLIKFYLGNKT